MCYTSDISKKSFTLSIIFFIILFSYSFTVEDIKIKNNIYILSLFFLFVGFMQLWDFIFWNTQDNSDKSNKINKNITKTAIIWNNIQPIILFLLVFVINKKVSINSIIITSIFLPLFLYMTYNSINKINKTNSYDGKIIWEWNYTNYSTIFYTLFLLTFLSLFIFDIGGVIGITLSFLSTFILLFSIYKYSVNMESGRYWCYFASSSSLIIFVILLMERMIKNQ